LVNEHDVVVAGELEEVGAHLVERLVRRRRRQDDVRVQAGAQRLAGFAGLHEVFDVAGHPRPKVQTLGQFLRFDDAAVAPVHKLKDLGAKRHGHHEAVAVQDDEATIVDAQAVPHASIGGGGAVRADGLAAAHGLGDCRVIRVFHRLFLEAVEKGVVEDEADVDVAHDGILRRVEHGIPRQRVGCHVLLALAPYDGEVEWGQLLAHAGNADVLDVG
jgi:hypothetical protein